MSGKAIDLTGRIFGRLRVLGPTPRNYDRPDLAPLERAVAAAGLPVETCGEFMWMGEFKPGDHDYKHAVTRLYVRLRIDTDERLAAATRWRVETE